ncbi:glycosyltransferase family 25 protein [Cucurbitaria berberidis CBS 394.84]|uniref:Glycosyltransferase family 25 protein n=1 Tax=Cucurbitaria berberidis CBS 394.84 TaxID=1168544 RepID=A0A9P4G8Z7_9PLEO|nr:glycosyltransferase family 25 protein [Cucurbitaria berberidis CBS 394.84]KAF1841169.1 glycosyltransferase family 25 protein [Cucurbitaria berberidis CBS 394.84]
MARRISIDTMGLMSPRSGAAFSTGKRRRPWYYSRPRLLTTCLFFGVLWMWFNFGGHEVLIPEDSFEYLKDESLSDILNTTLGFQKILVLNLPFRTDRRDAMSLSAAVSNIKLEFVDGVTGESIKKSAYPPPEENTKLLSGIRGSWRTHMNALQRVVEQNLTTAFILEDDVDWDIRVRQNLQRFALASRVLSQNNDILSAPNLKSQIEHRQNPETEDTAFKIIDTNNLPKQLPSLSLSKASKNPHLRNLKHNPSGATSPYGDPSSWDILWLGHCGAGMPRSPHAPSSKHARPSTTAANLLLTHPNDPTVPIPKHLKAHPFQGGPDPLATAYPPHTRIYHRSTGGELCTVGYAVTQRGARRLLHQFGLAGWNGIFDSELGRWCAGFDPDMGAQFPPTKLAPETERKGRKERVCVTSQPPIFAHHHPLQGESDIGGLGGGYARAYETKYLRYSVRMNLERLVQGRVGERELVDQWPDVEENEV